MEDPKPDPNFIPSNCVVNEDSKPNLNFTPSNCVVHDDTHGWGGFTKF